MIELSSLQIEGAYAVNIPVFSDSRGAFEIFWERPVFEEAGLIFNPSNAYHSYNIAEGTIRGLHYQKTPHQQPKLVSCVSGRAWDVMVDICPESPTYRQWCATILEPAAGNAVYLPSTCAHGFATLEPNTTIAYLIESEYRADASAVINWKDDELNIKWPIEVPVISEKDANAPRLKECVF